MVNTSDLNVAEMNLTFDLRIKDKMLQFSYGLYSLNRSNIYFRWIFIPLLVLYPVYCCVNYFVIDDMELWKFIFQMCIFGVYLAAFVVSQLPRMRHMYYFWSNSMLFMMFILKIIFDWINTNYQTTLLTSLGSLLTISNINSNLIMASFSNVLSSLSCFIKLLVMYYDDDYSFEITADNNQLLKFYCVSAISVIVFVISLNTIIIKYKTDKQDKNDFLSKDSIKQEKDQTDDILSVLVPKFVQDKISSMELAMTQDQDDVAILFAYVSDFDSIVQSEKQKIVQHLDQMFRAFDNLCL